MDTTSAIGGSKVFIFVMLLLFSAAILFKTIGVITGQVYKAIKTFLEIHKIDIPPMMVFDLAYCVLMIIFLVITWTTDYTYMNTWQNKYVSKAVFDGWVGYAGFVKLYATILFFVILLIFSKCLLMLKSKFPSFGTLFFTINAAKLQLFLYIILLATLLLSFLTAFILNFGTTSDAVSTFGSAFVATFSFMIGDPI